MKRDGERNHQMTGWVCDCGVEMGGVWQEIWTCIAMGHPSGKWDGASKHHGKLRQVTMVCAWGTSTLLRRNCWRSRQVGHWHRSSQQWHLNQGCLLCTCSRGNRQSIGHGAVSGRREEGVTGLESGGHLGRVRRGSKRWQPATCKHHQLTLGRQASWDGRQRNVQHSTCLPS